MPTIVKIGYHEYLLKREADAALIIKALTGAVRLEAKYLPAGSLYWPDEDHQTSVGIEVVRKDQILACKPDDATVSVWAARRRLDSQPQRKELTV